MKEKREFNMVDEYFLRALNCLMQRYYDGLNSKTLADMAQTSVRTIDYIISRQRGASKDVGEKIALALGLTYGQMIRLGELLVAGGDEEYSLTYIRNEERGVNPLQKKLEEDQEILFRTLADAYLIKFREWWGHEHGADDDSAWALQNALDGVFPAFVVWRNDRQIIKNAQGGGPAVQIGDVPTNVPPEELK